MTKMNRSWKPKNIQAGTSRLVTTWEASEHGQRVDEKFRFLSQSLTHFSGLISLNPAILVDK